MVRRARLASASPARWLALVLILAAACGGSSSGGDDDPTPDAGTGGRLEGLVTLAVTPSNVTLTADGDTPAVQAYTATGGFQDGSTRDVTAQVSWTVEDGALGRFQAASFTTSNMRGGRSIVRARAGEVIGIATLSVIIRQRHSDPGATDLPADPSGPFERGPADGARSPALVYPSTGVLLPPNLGRLEVHFTKHASNDLFAIDFKNDVTDVTVFTRCLVPLNGGCIYRPDADVWRWIADSNRGAATGVQVTVRGTDTAGTGVGTSGTITVAFSEDDIKGGIYYWVTGRIVNGQREEGGSIMRFDFAGTQTDAERFIDPTLTGLLPDGATAPPCGVGCHALSRDGKKLVAAAGGGSMDGRMTVVSVERGEMLAYPRPGVDLKSIAFSTWNPDGTQFAATFGNGGDADGTPAAPAGFVSFDINVFDGNTGAFVETIATNATRTTPAVHPEWSPDGKAIAFARGTRAASSLSTAQSIARTGIEIVRRDTAAWSAPVTLVAGADGKAACYPGFSPTGDLLAIGRSSCTGTTNDARCDCYDDPGAEVWIMKPEASAAPVELVKANTGGLTDIPAGAPAGTLPPKAQASYPKWSPFTFRRTDEQGSRLQWLTFSSKRNYGLYTPQQGQTLLWMAAVDPDAALAGVDPSYPAFVLPFQDISTSNHTAQWAERVIPDIDE